MNTRFLTMLAASAVLLLSFTACTERQSAERPYKGEKEEQARDIYDLQSTRYTVGTYAREFEELAMDVVDVKKVDEYITYELQKDGQRYLVVLTVPEETPKVQDIEIQELKKVLPEDEVSGDVEIILGQLEGMAPGKKPYEYVPLLEEIGTIDDYEQTMNNIEVELSVQDKRYEVEMNTDPNTGKVTDISIDRDVWGVL